MYCIDEDVCCAESGSYSVPYCKKEADIFDILALPSAFEKSSDLQYCTLILRQKRGALRRQSKVEVDAQ